mmetsp:Transcript_52613/g.104419  ORF Transcript_52613/g.104419 Transcript_52613/m.104419 type:complete len:200 (+) Transcript_52613:571-1170(+)
MHGGPPPQPCAAAPPQLPLPNGVPREFRSPSVQLHDHSVVFPKGPTPSAVPTAHCLLASSPRGCILAGVVCLKVQAFHRPDTIQATSPAAAPLALQPDGCKGAGPVSSFPHLLRLACSTLVFALTEGSSTVSSTSSRVRCQQVGSVGFPWLVWANSPESLLAPEVEKPSTSSPARNSKTHWAQTGLTFHPRRILSRKGS